MGESLHDFFLRTGRAAVLEQWDPTANGALTPDDLSYGSAQPVWWRCAQGHLWKAQARARAAGCGCPVCANRVVLAGENDLAQRYPDLAAQWDREKNGALTPRDVTPGAKRKVWWRCEKGHSWCAPVQARALEGNGCPVCAGKVVLAGENDLASRFPAVAAQWHPDKNGDLLPTQVTPFTKRQVWWRCPLGHDYRAAVGMRTGRDAGCPYCAGKKVLAGFNDLATTRPQVAAQWHPTYNGALTPQMITAGSHKKVWWQCAEGHVWKAAVYARAGKQQHGCPVCAGVVRGKRKLRYDALLADAARLRQL